MKSADLFAIFLLWALTTGGIAAYVGINQRDYLLDSRLNINPDALHYVLLGKNFWEKGVYSRMDREPYAPDAMRTPVYPLLAGGIDLVCERVWVLYVLQALCRAMLAFAVYYYGAAIFGRWVGFLAALLLAGDLSLAVLDFETLSESLFSLLAGSAFFLWLYAVFLSKKERVSLWRSFWIALLLGIAILVRPAGVYLPLVFSAAWLLVAWSRRNAGLVQHAVLLPAVAYACVVPWIIRNAVVFDLPRLTTADSINLVYFAGAGAYAVEKNVPLPEAQELIRQEYDLPSLKECNNPWQSGKDVRPIDDELRAATPRVLLKYKKSLVVSTTMGVAKALLAHNVGSLAKMAGNDWIPPGMEVALRGDFEACFRELARNDLFLIVAFFWEVLFAFALLGLGIVGGLIGLVTRRWTLSFICISLVAAYYLLTIAVVGLDAYGRHRSMLTPILAMGSALTLASLFRLTKREEASPVERRLAPTN